MTRSFKISAIIVSSSLMIKSRKRDYSDQFVVRIDDINIVNRFGDICCIFLGHTLRIVPFDWPRSKQTLSSSMNQLSHLHNAGALLISLASSAGIKLKYFATCFLSNVFRRSTALSVYISASMSAA